MIHHPQKSSFIRSRWAAVGAAVAVSLGAGGLGWVANAANSAPSTFVAITPCRLFDTRPAPDGVGDRQTPINPGEELTRQVTGANGNCNIPANATAIAYNLTVPTPLSGFLTLFPADAPRPQSSSINPVAGESVKANGGVVGLSATGAIKLYTLTGPTNALLDITGYYTAGGGGGQGVIPSGQTVRGELIYDGHSGTSTSSDYVTVNLPGIAPVALTDATVNFSASSGATVDPDASCTGTPQAPTAPPGRLCVYRGGSGGLQLAQLRVNAGQFLPTQAFLITVVPTGTDNGDLYLYGSWAYTAP